MTTPLDKVRRLIALALGTTAPEEARTAALTAVRIINEHKLLDATPASAGTSRGDTWWQDVVSRAAENVRRQREAAPPPPPPAPKPSPAATRKTAWEDLQEQARTASRGWPRSQPKPKPTWDPAEHKRPEAPPGYLWVSMKVGKPCLHCSEHVPVGVEAMWWKGHGFIHAACWPLAEPGAVR